MVGITGQIPTLDAERRLWLEGYRLVAGLDEVGRGAWAGPVFAAAVVFPCGIVETDSYLCQVRDSKQLSHEQRCELAKPIAELAVAVGLGRASHEQVDRLGVVAATRIAMTAALDSLGVCPDYLLIDAMQLPLVPLPQQGIIKGDTICLSIAAASIVAKVARDRLCEDLDRQYPGYGFACHKGYGTARHRQAIAALGVSPIHRLSYRPLREMLDMQEM
jgi:ribonuclease HII